MPAGNMTVSLRINADGTVAVNELNRLRGGLNSVDGSVRTVTNSLKSMAMTLTAALGVGSLASSFLAANKEASGLRAQLETATGSIDKATQAWEVLQNFAATTPFSLAEATKAFLTLKTRGLDATIEAMTSYGNTAAAMSKDVTQMAEAVADAVNGDFARLEEAFSLNAKQIGKNNEQVAITFKGVTTTIGNNAQEIQRYLIGIGKTEFAGGLARQSKTLAGVTSTLSDTWSQLMVAIGDTGATNAIGVAITELTSFLEGMTAEVKGATADSGIFMSTLSSLSGAIVATYSELKTGVWSDTTTAIMATAGAVAGWIALSTTLSVAIGAVTTAFSILTAVLMANPFTLAIAAIGATAGVLYALSDQTITLGDTTTTVGATVAAVWDTTATYSQAVWDTFSSFVSDQFNSLPPVVSQAGSAVLSVWSATMSGLMSVSGQAINYIMNLFRFVGRSAGVLAGEVAMSIESGFNFDRLKEGLAGEVQYTDMLGESGQKAAAGIKAAGKAVEEKSGKIAAANQVEREAAAAAAKLASDNAKSAFAAKLAAFEHDNLAKKIKNGTGAVSAGGAAHKGAAKEAAAHAKALDTLIAKYLPARDHADDMAKAVKELDLALAQGKITQAEYNEMLKAMADDLDKDAVKLQALIDKYDTEGARARALVKDREALNAELAKNPDRIKDINIALDKLTKAEQENTAEGKVWQTMWENAVKRIDDTFAGLWKDLFSGTKSTLESMKDAIASWLAEVAHALLTKPLVVAITTAMTGATGTAGAAGTAGQAVSGLSSFSSIGSMFSTAFSLGATFLEGVGAGFSTMLSGSLATIMEGFSFAGAGIASGTGAGIAGGIGYAMPYLAPLIIAGGLVLNKYFKDQEPRYGAYGATTTGRTDQFEDEVGVKGGFGLTFGMNDMGTANVDAEEMRGLFEGFAKVSTALADFYGKDVEAAVKASLAKASMENWGKNGLMNYAMNAEQAFQIAFTDIIKHAAATGDAVAVVMSSVVGSLQGTLEDMAGQIERGMMAAKAAVGMAEAFQGQEMGTRLGLGDKDTLGNALKLVDYANAMKDAGETTAEAIGRMALNLGVLDAALTLTGTKTDATGMAFIDLANSLAKAADEAKIGMQGLMQLQAAYYQHFFTEEERAIKMRDEMLTAIEKWNTENGRLGDAAITTSEQFRKYIESLDLQTEAGRQAYIDAMKMVGAFITLDDALKILKNTLDKLPTDIEAARKALTDLMHELDPTANAADQKAKNDAKNALLAAGYQGDFTGPSIAAFLKQLLAMDDSALEAYKALLKLQDGILALAKIAEQRAQMNVRLIELTQGREAALAAQRALELAALDPSLRALQQRIWLLEDEATALNELNGIMDRIYNAIGADDLARELQRKLELAAADARNRPFLLLLYQIEDEQRARQKQLEAEKTALAAAHTARMEALAQEREATQELLTTAQGLLSSIQSALSSLRSQLPLDEINLARSRRALADWASAKQLPDQKSLDRAITGIGGDDAKNYATASAYLLAKQGDLVNLLTLEQLAQTKVSNAEKLLQSLDNLQSALTKQHEAAMAALDAKYALDEDWKKRQLDLLNELLAKMYPDQAPADRMPMKYQLPPVPKDDQERQDKRFGDVIAEIALLRRDMANLSAAQIAPLKSLDDRVKKWDLDGLPGERDAAEMSYLRAA